MNTENAQITSTRLGYEDHGILTCFIFLDGKGWGGGFGGYALDNFDKSLDRRVATEAGFEAIAQLLRTLEAKNWEDLKGTHVRVETPKWGAKITKIGHLIKDQWFSFEEFFAEWEKLENSSDRA